MESRPDKPIIDLILLCNQDVISRALLLNRVNPLPSLRQVNILISCEKFHEHAVSDNNNVLSVLTLEAVGYLKETLSHPLCTFSHSIIVGGVATGFLQPFFTQIIKR